MQKILCYGLVYVAEGLIAWFYLDHLFLRKRKLWQHIVQFVLSYAVLFSLSQLDNAILNALCFTGVHWFLIGRNYCCGVKTALIHAALLCFWVMVGEVLVSLILTLLGYAFSEYTHNNTIMIVFAIWSKLLYLLLAVIGARIFSPHRQRDERKEPGAMFLFCMMPFSSALLSVVIILIGMSSDVNPAVGVTMAISMSALLIMNLLFLGIYNYIQKINAEHLRTQLSIQKENANVLYYQALQEQSESQRILIHDIKNHMHAIKAL